MAPLCFKANSVQTGDYDDFITLEEEKVKALLKPASQLILEIEVLLSKH